jgi:hypothetical protein
METGGRSASKKTLKSEKGRREWERKKNPKSNGH